MFSALVVEKDEDRGKTQAAVKQIGEDDLPQAEVTVAVEYSTLNYKDGLCIGPGGGWCATTPMCRGSISPGPSRRAAMTVTSRATRWY